MWAYCWTEAGGCSHLLITCVYSVQLSQPVSSVLIRSRAKNVRSGWCFYWPYSTSLWNCHAVSMTEHEEALAQSALLLTTRKVPRWDLCADETRLRGQLEVGDHSKSFRLPAPTETSSRGFKYLVSLPLGQMRRKGLCLFTDKQRFSKHGLFAQW